MTTKRRVRVAADDTAGTIVQKVNRFVRGGLRREIKDGVNWAPVWVRSADGNTWRVERQYGGAALITIELDKLPRTTRATVVQLIDLLREQAQMARIARHVAAEPVERDAKIAATSKAGGARTAEKYARPDLDDLIRGCLERSERTRDYAKEWAADFGVSADTVERAIKRIKRELDKA